MIGRTMLVLAAAALAAASLHDAAPPSDTTAAVVDSIASPTAPGSAEPNLTLGADGKVYLSWLEPAPDSATALRFAIHDGMRWSAPMTIVSRRDLFVNWADFPSLQVLDGNRLAAHWLQRTGRGTYAYGVRIANSRNGGATWSEPVIPHRDSSQTEHGFVAMWRERNSLGAVWLDGRKFNKEGHSPSNEMMLMTTSFDARGVQGAEVPLDDRTCDCCQNAAAMTSVGPIVAFRNRTADEIRDIHVTRRVGGKWTPGVAVHNDRWKIAACPVNGPALAAVGNRVALAWFTAPADSARVNVAFSSDAGATFGAPVRVDDGKPAGRVGVALLPDGDALVTWVERIGGDTAAVRVRRIARSGTRGAATTIASSSAARASGFPKMAVTGSIAMFAWTVPGRPSMVRVARTPVSTLR